MTENRGKWYDGHAEVLMNYLTRYIEKDIESALETSGVVVVAGPKFCGKTTTSRLFAKSEYALDTKEKIALTQSSPASVLIGGTPRLIDEWQHVPDLWNHARSEIDRRDDKFGQFLFTGSSTPASMEDIYHSGAGRIVTLKMRPMSLFESKESLGEVSLRNLFNDPSHKVFISNENHMLQDTAFYLCRGGWPLSLTNDRNKALKITENYCSTLFEFENNKNAKFRNKKKSIFQMIVRSYARHVSTEARRKKMIADINEHDDRNLDPETFDEYLQALKDLYIIEDIEAWNPNFRSATTIVTSPTRHFVDTSVAAGALHVSPEDLMNDPRTFGFLFEDFAVRELCIYTQSMGGEIRHYRDGNGLECDAVIHLKDGRYALVEIKLGGEPLVAGGIATLQSMKNKIAKAGQPSPSFYMILTAAGAGYTTPDGIHVVPVNALRD